MARVRLLLSSSLEKATSKAALCALSNAYRRDVRLWVVAKRKERQRDRERDGDRWRSAIE